MAKHIYPIFGICNLADHENHNGLLAADRFKSYLERNPHLHVVHKHSFYHLVYFTAGSGEHVIDFESFPVNSGMIYFMRPGQVHNWQFKDEVDGYIINFAPAFFEELLAHPKLIDQFPFFGTDVQQQVIVLKPDTRKKVESIFEAIIVEQSEKPGTRQLMTGTLLLQLFILVSRDITQPAPKQEQGYNSTILQNFQQLIEDNFSRMKLPKDYAALMYITPNHLNALCRDLAGISAGEMIRNRILLEAKRLLINFDLSIGGIAAELNFPDSSYFVKFFKKHTGSTPEAFRNKNAQTKKVGYE